MKRLLPWLVILLAAIPLVFWAIHGPDDTEVSDVLRDVSRSEDFRPSADVAPAVSPVAGDALNAAAVPVIPPDPDTGLPGPMQRQIESMTRRDSAGLVEEVMPDGSVRVRLQQRFRQAPVAIIDDTGELHITEY